MATSSLTVTAKDHGSMNPLDYSFVVYPDG